MKNKLDIRKIIYVILILLLFSVIILITSMIDNELIIHIWQLICVPIGFYGFNFLKELSYKICDWFKY